MTVTASPSPSPSLDTQGVIFCTLVDKARAASASADPLHGDANGALSALEDAIPKLNAAAKRSSNPAVHSFITSIGAALYDADFAKARTVCESQGWVGTP